MSRKIAVVPESRIAQLEDELKLTKERLANLRNDLDEATALVTKQREWLEDYQAEREQWVEALGFIEKDGVYTQDPERSLWSLHDELIDKHNKLVRKWNRYAAETHGRSPGRPLAASWAQVDEVLKHRKAGLSLRRIAAATGVGVKTVQSILAKQEQATEKRCRVFDAQRARDFRQRKRLIDRALSQMTGLRQDGESLIKQAKGL